MSRIINHTISKGAGWSFGFGVVNMNCRCLIGKLYLWRWTPGFVFDFFCKQHRAVNENVRDLVDAVSKNEQSVRERFSNVEVIKRGDPRHTKLVESLRQHGSKDNV